MTWLDGKDMQACLKIQHDLLATYRDDFHKYGGEIDARLLHRIMLSVTRQLGNKFVYTRVDPDVKIPLVKSSMMLLTQAKVCSKVAHTSGNGLPLGAESNDKFFKALMVDIGLISAHLELSSVKHTDLDSMLLSNRGGYPSSLLDNSCVPPKRRQEIRSCFTGREPVGVREKLIIFFSMGIISSLWKSNPAQQAA